jgi:hypothetical protein
VKTPSALSSSPSSSPSSLPTPTSPPPSTPAPESEAHERPVEGNWASPVSHLKVGQLPPEAVNLNVEGRQVVGPLQGFGQLWQKTYRVHLRGVAVTPAEVVAVWKVNLPKFQPPENRFYTSVAGVEAGEVVMINAQTPGGLVSTGVLVMYSDDESFTLMTPQGHPESGWVTFSAFEEDGCTVAQVQSIGRSNDPFYEMMFRLIGSREQERIWKHVLTSLAAHYDLQAQVEFSKSCVDPRMQWKRAGNIWHNAAIRTTMNKVSAPVRRLRGK